MIIGLDFSSSNLPQITASANFLIPVKRVLSENRLSQWQKESDMLDYGVLFYWCIDNIDESLDLNLLNHQGLGMELEK